MIFELADGGTLRQHLAKHFNGLTWKDKYNLALGIANGLRHLHAHNIVHKDLVFVHVCSDCLHTVLFGLFTNVCFI